MFLVCVTAEMDNVWLVQQQETLQIDWPCSRMLVQLKFVTVWTFLKFLEDLPGFFVYENSACSPWVGR